jgi:hypothetical protein
MYDHDREDIDVLGWEEFILRQWESIFLGYRSTAAVRTVGRRWSDLIEVGIGCPQDIADELVMTEIVEREDRTLASAANPTELLAEMIGVLDGLSEALTRLPQVLPDQLAGMVEQHARLVRVIGGEPEDDEVTDAVVTDTGASASS